MVRMALIGCGRHSGHYHATPLARFAQAHPKRLQLAAACDLDRDLAQTFCRKYGFEKAYVDAWQMIEAERPDAVVCVVAVPAIARLGVELLHRGIPCVIEKPPGATPEEADHLLSVSLQTGTPHMVSVNRRFIPPLNETIAWCRAQGPISFVRGSILRHERTEPSFIWGTAIHTVDALRHIGGDVASFDARMVGGRPLTARWFDVTLKFTTNAMGQVAVLPTCGAVEESYEIFGEGYRARVALDGEFRAHVQCWRGGKLAIERRTPEDEPADVSFGSYHEVEAFVKAIESREKPRPSLADVVPSARIGFEIARRFRLLGSS
jgi:myo-inositol 2-dehydrogenase/D-chiro-inositol 1-dehydrogenase